MFHRQYQGCLGKVHKFLGSKKCVYKLLSQQAPTINHTTFSRSFKEWKFLQFELDCLQGLDWMKCPSWSISQHSCYVDGNMKLYRFKTSGRFVFTVYSGVLLFGRRSELLPQISRKECSENWIKVLSGKFLLKIVLHAIFKTIWHHIY